MNNLDLFYHSYKLFLKKENLKRSLLQGSFLLVEKELFWNITKAPPDKQNSCFGQLVKKSHILDIYDNNTLKIL